ncbi:MAG: M1 family peptidase [Terrimonas sp.]|nr:M1 family peptidase [Terrimonas sp.]
MKKILFLLLAAVFSSFLFAQETEPQKDDSWKKIYRETATRINDLVHTKLEVKPDFGKSYLYGKAWITLRPHFYATDSLTLDAKGMDIHKVALVKGTKQLPLQYEYNDWQLRIKLDKSYSAKDSYTIYIDYTAKPDEFQEKYAGPDALLGIKGMYFINPKGEEKDKPTQIWTQGETESNSAWFPTIDKTNQKTTEELTVTVDNKYVTLSNGKLVSQKKNADGTRTDYWKMDLPHAPYLFFLGVGDYAVIKDTYKGKEVNYYVEPAYASVAKRIFGNTPEMMGYFSKITGVEYPWIKYSQITGRDYVAGAMENTTATIHQDAAQQDARELVDGNNWESTIAHELFHQWFGDYVTTESWSNITVNESFADYSQTLWEEYKYGKDAGAAENYSGMLGYLSGSSANIARQGGDPENGSDTKDLVRFYYNDREDVFDLVSYQKGGRILNMLRNYVGDSAFFKSLNNYLTTNKFKSAEAHQLRLAFEEVTGRDLNWFFNQWYFGSGHPNVTIDYIYDDAAGKVSVVLKQIQKTGKIFKLPIAIDIYNSADKKRYNVWVQNETDTFTFHYDKHPDLVNVDADKVMLWEKKDNKTLDNFIHQYKYAGNYVDRREAIMFAAKQKNDPKALNLLTTALHDPFAGLRNLSISQLDLKNDKVKASVEPILLDLAKNDQKSTVRANAINALGTYEKKEYEPLFTKAVNDSSYSVSGNALQALSKIDEPAALQLAKKIYPQPVKGALKESAQDILINSGDEGVGEKLLDEFEGLPLGNNKFALLQSIATYLQATDNEKNIKRGVDQIAGLRDAIPEAFKAQTDPYLNGILKQVLASKVKALKDKAGDPTLQGIVDYIKTKLPEEEKKGF